MTNLIQINLLNISISKSNNILDFNFRALIVESFFLNNLKSNI